MNQELIRIVENIAKDKNIDKESIFQDLEAAEKASVDAVRELVGLDGPIVLVAGVPLGEPGHTNLIRVI